MSTLSPAWDANGLVPVIVQDETDGRVLMVAYMNAAALAETVATGDVHFHSRSRGRLWRKGETSGNVLRLVRLELDCDGDALLATVRPAGPTCHRGTRSCFDVAGPATDVTGASVSPPPRGFGWLEELWTVIDDRRRMRPAGSYTTSLLDGGVDVAGRKLSEEATEVLMAAKDDDASERAGRDRAETRDALAAEAADLLYHALVLLAERDVDPARVIEILRARHAG